MAAVLTQPTLDATHFETLYAEAGGDASRIPWADGRPHPALVTWLNAVAPSLLRCGSRVVVVGCGLGDDARELIKRGYDVTAFDVSRTAVEWAKRLDPENARCYVQADVFALPARWQHRFDLVVEINTIQALPPERRGATMNAISGLMSAHGRLLVICRALEQPDQAADADRSLEEVIAGQSGVDRGAGPPWPLTKAQLQVAADGAGLVADGPISVFTDDEEPPVLRMRAMFKRA